MMTKCFLVAVLACAYTTQALPALLDGGAAGGVLGNADIAGLSNVGDLGNVDVAGLSNVGDLENVEALETVENVGGGLQLDDYLGGLYGITGGALDLGLKKRDSGVSITISGIQMVTQMSADLDAQAKSINLVNVLFVGAKIGIGFQNIVATLPKALNNLSGMSPLNDLDARNVVAVLKTFVAVHQALLQTVIGKHGILSLFFFTQPIRIALVALEAVVDEYALALIALIPTRQPEGNKAKTMLDVSIGGAIRVYT